MDEQQVDAPVAVDTPAPVDVAPAVVEAVAQTPDQAMLIAGLRAAFDSCASDEARAFVQAQLDTALGN